MCSIDKKKTTPDWRGDRNLTAVAGKFCENTRKRGRRRKPEPRKAGILPIGFVTVGAGGKNLDKEMQSILIFTLLNFQKMLY